MAIEATAENVHELKAMLCNLGNDIDKLDTYARKMSYGVMYVEFATFRRMLPKGHDDVFQLMRDLADAIHAYEDRPARGRSTS